MIEETGHVAVERDTLYRVIAVRGDEDTQPAWNAGPIGAPPLMGVASGTTATGAANSE